MLIGALAYALALVIFLAIDLVWLSIMGSALYRPALGNILLENFRSGPAIVFYLIFPIGIVLFAIHPALESGHYQLATIDGALLGFFAYATYDLTNFSTLRNWTLTITAVDIVWGSLVTSVAATLACVAVKLLTSKLGLSV